MSTPTPDGFDTTVLLDRAFSVGDVEVDGTGQIHLAGSTREDTGSRIDYLLLGS